MVMNLLPSLSFSAPARAGASLTDDIRKGGSLRMRAPQSTGCLVEAAEAAQQAAEEEESVQAESSPHRPASISVPRNSGAGTGNDSSEAGHKLPSHSSSSFHDDVEGRSCASSHMHMERVPNDALPEMVAPPLDSDAYRWVGVRHRTKSLCRVFGLPNPKEDLLSEFHGALRKRVLLQGRIYVFANYICFTSNPFFGYIKKTVVHFQKIKAVRKKTHCRVPNSIEIELVSGKKEFFTNLLNRQDAYDVIWRCWSRVRPCQSNQQQCPAIPDSSGSLEGHSDTDAGSPRVGLSDERFGVESLGRKKRADQQLDQRKAHADSGTDAHSPLARNRISTVSLGAWSNTSTLHERVTLASDPGSDDDVDDEDGNTVFNVIESTPPPPKASDARLVLSTVLTGTAAALFDVLLASESHFMEDFLENDGNRRINLTPWKRHHQLAHVRDLAFVAPIRGAFGNWGVSHTQCFQSHRFCRHTGDHLVFESSQTMTDIPYGDCFTVDVRWDIVPTTIAKEGLPPSVATPGLAVDIVMRVPFQRRCLFKKVIESGTQKQILQTYTAMVDALQPALLEASFSSDLPLHADVEGLKARGSLAGSMGSGGNKGVPALKADHSGSISLRSLPSKGVQEDPHITVSHGQTRISLSPSSSLFSPAVLDFMRAENSVKAQHVGCLSSYLLESITRPLRIGLRTFNNFVLGLVGCSMSPQLLWLTIMVTAIFACQLYLLYSSVKPTHDQSSAFPSAGGMPMGAGEGDMPSSPFYSPSAATTTPTASSASFAATSATDAGLGMGSQQQQFWAQRLELLQMELGMLQRRMQLVAGEIDITQQQQQQQQQ